MLWRTLHYPADLYMYQAQRAFAHTSCSWVWKKGSKVRYGLDLYHSGKSSQVYVENCKKMFTQQEGLGKVKAGARWYISAVPKGHVVACPCGCFTTYLEHTSHFLLFDTGSRDGIRGPGTTVHMLNNSHWSIMKVFGQWGIIWPGIGAHLPVFTSIHLQLVWDKLLCDDVCSTGQRTHPQHP